jgi:AraC-like DNA-binding protein
MRALEKTDRTDLPTKVEPLRALRPFVKYVRTMHVVRDAAPYVRLPDGELELTIQLSSADELFRVVGTRSKALRKHVASAERVFSVRFRSGGAYPFFGVPLDELTNEIVPLDALWGTQVESLRAALDRATSVQAQELAVQTALVARLQAKTSFEPSGAPVVRRAIRTMQASASPLRIEQLARALDVSSRHLRRSFAEVVGVCPKTYARVLRFQRALRAAQHGPPPAWSAIAEATGYFDQAHMIAEFRALADASPSELVRARRVQP